MLSFAAAASLPIAPAGPFQAVPEAVRFRIAASLATIAAVSTAAAVGDGYFLYD